MKTTFLRLSIVAHLLPCGVLLLTTHGVVVAELVLSSSDY